MNHDAMMDAIRTRTPTRCDLIRFYRNRAANDTSPNASLWRNKLAAAANKCMAGRCAQCHRIPYAG